MNWLMMVLSAIAVVVGALVIIAGLVWDTHTAIAGGALLMLAAWYMMCLARRET